MQLILLVILLLLPISAGATDKLLQSSDMTYLGAFRLPADPVHGGTLWYTDGSGHGLAFRPPTPGNPNGSLFMAGQYYGNNVMEISIPSTLSTSSSVSSLTRSGIIQPLTDIASGIKTCIYSNGCDNKDIRMGGLLVYNNELLGTLYDAYTRAGDMTKSSFKAPLTLTANSAAGVYAPTAKSRSIAGYMAAIPANWQAALGGKILSGLHEVSIITATSYLPTAFAYDPVNFSVETPFTATPLMYVDDVSHHTTYGYLGTGLSAIGSTSDITSNADSFGGAVFPEGSKSVLFIRAHGNGQSCYGERTLNPALHMQIACGDGSETCCYDPEGSAKGPHAYPYVYQVMAYSADDLAAVKAGTLAHNSVVPYAHWELTFPVAANNHSVLGVAYDSSSQKIYLSQDNADGQSPIIQAYQVDLTPSPAPTVTDGIKVRANRVKAHIQ